ncbi:hypothetical protein [Bdellovibrio sp. HCB337]|uniref:hypothetical protein n=1 Tax=Bdellovibrio sp. HCB337 TaxID=3394358 RepID=UPI0039A67C89
MKSVLIYALTLISFHAFAGEGALEKIQDAEVFIFDATCTPTSAAEGFLTVQLRAQKESISFYASGGFHSYNEALRNTDRWSLLPLQHCHEVASQLALLAGRKLVGSGEVYLESYQTTEDVIGKCRAHPLDGGGTFPCKKGTRPVTKYKREVVLNVSGINLISTEN